MNEPTQMSLIEEPKATRVERRGSDLIRAMQAAVAALTAKEVAYWIGKPEESEVLNAIKCRDRKTPPLAWVLALIEMDPEHRLLRWLADQVGCDVVPKRRLTEGEQLAALRRAALTELGPTMGPLLLRRAGVE